MGVLVGVTVAVEVGEGVALGDCTWVAEGVELGEGATVVVVAEAVTDPAWFLAG